MWREEDGQGPGARGQCVRLRHIQLPEEARDLDKELKQVGGRGMRVGGNVVRSGMRGARGDARWVETTAPAPHPDEARDPEVGRRGVRDCAQQWVAGSEMWAACVTLFPHLPHPLLPRSSRTRTAPCVGRTLRRQGSCATGRWSSRPRSRRLWQVGADLWGTRV